VEPESLAADAAPEGAAQLPAQSAGSPETPPQAPRPNPGTIVVPHLTEKPGDTIGRYKLLQLIGEGGFGVVYMAQQQEPVKRRVALKIVKLGMDTRQVVGRFEAERQALALMDHPNIAKVLDAGATDQGRPYFVMELVKGIRITDYCDQNHLSPRERLDLFVPICRAIQHAHQKGIIHRDIKPSNVLVTLHDGLPVPKIIDFGIAKATQQELTEHTVFTQFGQFIGTPAYMSPEQAEMSGLDIDTRSDIYSLGVLLYELLTGKTPFDAKELLAAGLEGMRRMIREQEPARPSTRLSTLLAAELTTTAKHRHVEAPKLVRLLRGDLDWIVMKCLEKDRTRRYETASSFAEDIESFLRNEPVKARPPSTAYRLQKFIRRNKASFAASAAVTLALLAGLVFSTSMFLREQQARRQSQEVTRIFQEMLKGVGPSVALGRDTVLLREVLDKTIDHLATDLRDQPAVQAEIWNTIGEVYRALGHANQAEQMHRFARGLQGKPTGGQRAEVATSLNDLAGVLRDQGKLAEAEALGREVLELRLKPHGKEHPEVAMALNNLALTLRQECRLAEAESLHRRALAMQRHLLTNQNQDVAVSLNNLALTLREEGKFSEAKADLEEALKMEQIFWGSNSPLTATTLDNLAFVQLDLGRLDEASALEGQSLELLCKLFPRGHPAVATGLNNLGLILTAQDNLPEAQAKHERALAMRRELRGPEHPEVAASLDNLALVLRKRKQLDEAQVDAQAALAMRKELLGDRHPAVAASLNTWALVLESKGHWPDAEKAFHDALAIQRERLGPDHPAIATTLNNLALLLSEESKAHEAATTIREALEMREKLLGEQHPSVAESRKDLTRLLALERQTAKGPTPAAEVR
jgi:serine/threonine protein kinase/Tfp pilus assembly protein PilF